MAQRQKRKNSIKSIYFAGIICLLILAITIGFQIYKNNQKLRELAQTSAADFADPFTIQLWPKTVGPGQSYQINASQPYSGTLDYQLRRCDLNNTNCVFSTGAYPVSMVTGRAEVPGTLTTAASPGIYNVKFKPTTSTVWSNEFAQTLLDPAVEVTPAATTPQGHYRIQFYTRANLNGQQIFAKTWKCTNRIPKTCTTPTDGSAVLTRAGNIPYTILNNVVDVDLGTFSNVPEGLYYFQLRPQSSPTWSNVAEVNVTSLAKPNDLSSVNGYEQNIQKKLQQIFQNQQAFHPLGNAPGVGGGTVNGVLARNLNKEQTVFEIEKLLCGEPPFPPNTNPQTIPFSVAEGSPRANFALWSDCASAQDYLMMLYFRTKNDPDRVTSFAYALTTHHEDMISSGANNPYGFINAPLYNPNFNYALEYTHISYIYTNDAGMGTLGGIGWMKRDGFLKELYCTTKEFPYAPGSNCKTINLFDRIRTVTSAMATRSWNTWYSSAAPLTDAAGRRFKQGIDPAVNAQPVFQAYNSAGMSIESKLARSFLGPAHFSMRDKAASLVSSQFGVSESSTNFPLTNGLQYLVTSDNFQHLGVMGEVFDWIFPAAWTNNARIWANVYLTNYFDKAQPLVDIAHNSYIQSTISNRFPNSIGACGTGKAFSINTNGVVVGIRGEHPSDAVITSAPALYYLLKQSNEQGLAIEVLDSLERVIDSVTTSPPNWREELCDTTPLIGIVPKTELSVNARVFAGYYFALETMNKASIPAITPVTAVPTPSPTVSPSPSPSPTLSPSPSPTLSPSPSPTRSASPSPSPSHSPSPTPTRSPSPVPTATPTSSPIAIDFNCSNQSFYTVNNLNYAYTKDCLSVPRAMYTTDSRFTIFLTPAETASMPFIKTDNITAKEDRNLNWSISLTYPSTVYVFYRHIPGQTARPAWLSSGYTRVTTDDLSNIQQYLLRKNELGLIGLYDIYKKTPLFTFDQNGNGRGGVTLGPASDNVVTAYSMYLVGVKPLPYR